MTKSKDSTISIPAMNLETFQLHIVGDSPLIVHAWDEKAKLMMLQKQQKKATAGREARSEAYVEYAKTLYWVNPQMPDVDNMSEAEVYEEIDKATFGFPVVGFKAAAIDAGYQQGILDKKTTARGAFHIVNGEYAIIEGKPTMREDMVKIGMGTAEVRYRAEFKQWATTLLINYNKNAMSMEQIANLFNTGGFSNGVGEWRPARDGSFGRVHVE